MEQREKDKIAAGIILIIAAALIVGVCSDTAERERLNNPPAPDEARRVQPAAPAPKPARQTAATECENLARRKGVQLSAGLKTRDLGGEMIWYGANATYQGNRCQFVCLFWGGEMDSAACMHATGAGQTELFCANPPCFR